MLLSRGGRSILRLGERKHLAGVVAADDGELRDGRLHDVVVREVRFAGDEQARVVARSRTVESPPNVVDRLPHGLFRCVPDRTAGVAGRIARATRLDQLVGEESVDDAIDVERSSSASCGEILERAQAVDQEEDLPLVDRQRDLFGLRIGDDAKDDVAVGKQAMHCSHSAIRRAPSMMRLDRSMEIVTAWAADRSRREGERAARPDESVEEDLGDLDFQEIVDLLLGEDACSTAISPKRPPPRTMGSSMRRPVRGDLVLAQQNRSEPERLLAGPGVDDLSDAEEDVGLVLARGEGEHAGGARGGQEGK